MDDGKIVSGESKTNNKDKDNYELLYGGIILRSNLALSNKKLETETDIPLSKAPHLPLSLLNHLSEGISVEVMDYRLIPQLQRCFLNK